MTQELEWTGWRINTAEFKIYVTEKKLLKAELKLDVLLRMRGKKIKVKDLCSVVGLIISFDLGVGRAARFHTRLSTMKVAKVVDERGWGSFLVMSCHVMEELSFWRENVRSLNG